VLSARGAALVGRRVVREFSGVPFAGAVVAHEGGRWAYRVRYSDGDEDTNTLREVREILQPEEAEEAEAPRAKRRRTEASRGRARCRASLSSSTSRCSALWPSTRPRTRRW
jgi:predicted P-loop ATPase